MNETTSSTANTGGGREFPQFALYYPWPPVDNGVLSRWFKSILLFFDGLALIAPPEALPRVLAGEEETAVPLLESGLLRLLDPRELIDSRAAETLLDFLLRTAAGEFDDSLGIGSGTDLERAQRDAGLIYQSRGLIVHNTEGIAKSAAMLWRDLQDRGLVSQPLTDRSVRAHPVFWLAYQTLLAHVVKPAGAALGLDLQPITTDRKLGRGLATLLDMPRQPSTGRVVQFDFNNVGLDLTDVPLQDIFDFKAAHGLQFRRYRADVRLFAYELSQAPSGERKALFAAREVQLADASAELRRLSRRWWRRPLASIALGGVGATWYGAHGAWDDAVVALLAGLVGAGGRPKFDDAFCYLLAARDRLGT